LVANQLQPMCQLTLDLLASMFSVLDQATNRRPLAHEHRTKRKKY